MAGLTATRTEGWFTRVPSPKVPSYMRPSHAISSTVESMEVGTSHFTRVPSPKPQVT